MKKIILKIEGYMNRIFFNKLFFIAFFVFFFCGEISVFADTKKVINQMHVNEDSNDAPSKAFIQWKNDFAVLAKKEGITPTFVDFILTRMELIPSVVRSDRNQPEFLTGFWEYMDRAVSSERIKKGYEMLHRHAKQLNDVALKYDVPAHYLVAFWGLETNYGKYKGNISTLNALTTLAFDQRRRNFFTQELITFLKIMDREKTLDFKGSWAGAFGHFQFMPTTYMAYAVDGNNDGSVDVVHDLEDAFASAGHYLKTMHWQKNIRWGREVVFQKKLDWSQLDYDTEQPIHAWEKLGVMPADGTLWKAEDKEISAVLRMPAGIDGPLFLTYDNFKTIMRWNKSELYALAVGLLADRISGQSDRIYKHRVQRPFSYKNVKQIQYHLRELGYYTGEIDGRPGVGTRTAIKAYQKDNGLPQDGFMDEKLLNKIKGYNK